MKELSLTWKTIIRNLDFLSWEIFVWSNFNFLVTLYMRTQSLNQNDLCLSEIP